MFDITFTGVNGVAAVFFALDHQSQQLTLPYIPNWDVAVVGSIEEAGSISLVLTLFYDGHVSLLPLIFLVQFHVKEQILLG